MSAVEIESIYQQWVPPSLTSKGCCREGGECVAVLYHKGKLSVFLELLLVIRVRSSRCRALSHSLRRVRRPPRDDLDLY